MNIIRGVGKLLFIDLYDFRQKLIHFLYFHGKRIRRFGGDAGIFEIHGVYIRVIE